MILSNKRQGILGENKMRKKIYLIILLLMLFIPVFTYPIKKKQDKTKLEDIRILTNAELPPIPFIYGSSHKPITIDPINCWDSASATIIDQVAETLFIYNYSDPTLPLIPLLATNYTLSPDGLNYTINLRENVLFHDGSKFNATVVYWNFNRMEFWFNFSGYLPSDQKLGYPLPLFYFEDCKTPIWNHTTIIDWYKIEIILNAPFVPFLNLLTYSATAMVSPIHHGWDFTRPFTPLIRGKIIGTGPFVYEYYDNSSDEVKFHAFENYWNEKANVTEIIFSYYDDDISLNNALLAGDIHFINDIALSFLDTFKFNPDITVLDEGKTEASLVYIAFNNRMVSHEMRRAFSYAINYSYLIEEIMGDSVERLKSPIPEEILYANWSLNYADFNITKARLIMQAYDPATFGGLDLYNDTVWKTLAGTWDIDDWHTGPTQYYIKMWVYASNPLHNTTYTLCRDWFELIGIKLVDEVTNWSTFTDNFKIDPDWIDIWLLGFQGCYNDPSYFTNPLLSAKASEEYWINYAQINDAMLNTWIEQGKAETNPLVRKIIYEYIQRRAVEDLMPYAWLWVNKLYHAHYIGLTNFTQNIFDKKNFYYCKWDPPLTYNINIISSGNISFVKGSTGNFINWTILTDAIENPTYDTYINDLLNTSGIWEYNEPIIVDLDSLDVGIYEFRIEVFNGNKTAEDLVIVTVMVPKSPETVIPGYSVLFLVAISVITIHYHRKKLKKNLH